MALNAFNTGFKEPFFENAKLDLPKTSFTYTNDSVNLMPMTKSYITLTFTFSWVKVLGSRFNVSAYFALTYNYCVHYEAATVTAFNIPFGNIQNYYSSTLSLGKPAKQTDNQHAFRQLHQF